MRFLLEELLCLQQIEAQRGRFHFQQLIERPQRDERKRRLLAACQHQMTVGWGVLNKERDAIVYAGMSDPVIVLQEHIDLVVNLSYIVYQGGSNRVGTDQETLVEQGQRALAEPLACVLQRLRYVQHEALRFVILRIDRQPGHDVAAPAKQLRPPHSERGL